jgi:hypothetical protein
MRQPNALHFLWQPSSVRLLLGQCCSVLTLALLLQDSEELLTLLLECGANVSAKDCYGNNAANLVGRIRSKQHSRPLFIFGGASHRTVPVSYRVLFLAGESCRGRCAQPELQRQPTDSLVRVAEQ